MGATFLRLLKCLLSFTAQKKYMKFIKNINLPGCFLLKLHVARTSDKADEYGILVVNFTVNAELLEIIQWFLFFVVFPYNIRTKHEQIIASIEANVKACHKGMRERMILCY